MGHRHLIALISLATVPACGSGGGGKPDSAVAPGDAWVELGTGTTEFEELAPEQDITLVSGPQGGHHFIVTARMHAMQPGDPSMPGTVENPSTRFTVWNEAGEQIDVDPPPYRLGYEPVGDGIYVLPSGHIIQVREDAVPSLDGARIRIRVELEDQSGATVTDERWLIARPDGGLPPPDAGPPAATAEIGAGPDVGDVELTDEAGNVAADERWVHAVAE